MSKKIVELVNTWYKYETENPDISIADFCVKYLAEHNTQSLEEWHSVPVNGQLAGLLGRLVKYSNLYSKKALNHFLSTAATCLITLCHTSPTLKCNPSIYFTNHHSSPKTTTQITPSLSDLHLPRPLPPLQHYYYYHHQTLHSSYTQSSPPGPPSEP